MLAPCTSYHTRATVALSLCIARRVKTAGVTNLASHLPRAVFQIVLVRRSMAARLTASRLLLALLAVLGVWQARGLAKEIVTVFPYSSAPIFSQGSTATFKCDCSCRRCFSSAGVQSCSICGDSCSDCQCGLDMHGAALCQPGQYVVGCGDRAVGTCVACRSCGSAEFNKDCGLPSPGRPSAGVTNNQPLATTVFSCDVLPCAFWSCAVLCVANARFCESLEPALGPFCRAYFPSILMFLFASF